MESKQWSNYKITEQRVSSDIDRTISQIMRKPKIIENKENNLHDSFGLIRSFDINLIEDHLGSLKEIPNWYREDYHKYHDDRYHKDWTNVCDCCGNFSIECICKRCQVNHYQTAISTYVEDGEYENAIEFIIHESR